MTVEQPNKKRRVKVSEDSELSSSDYDELMNRINEHSHPDDDCIVVDYALTDGTARMDYDRQSFYCHVVAFEARNGKKKKPIGMFVAHKCKQMASRVRNCVKDGHTILVNSSEFAKMQSATPAAVARVKKVKAMLSEKKSIKEICDETGMKKTAVYDIQKHKSWTFIE